MDTIKLHITAIDELAHKLSADLPKNAVENYQIDSLHPMIKEATKLLAKLYLVVEEVHSVFLIGKPPEFISWRYNDLFGIRSEYLHKESLKVLFKAFGITEETASGLTEEVLAHASK